VLNHFDDFFAAHVAPRVQLELKRSPALRHPHGGPFPSDACLWILRATAVILDNCSNKQLYGSTEHLSSLLASEQIEVAVAALYVLASATRRAPGARSNRFHSDHKLRARLLALCSGLGDTARQGDGGGSSAGGGGGGDASPPTLVLGMSVGGSGAGGKGIGISASDDAGAVHFEFYSPRGADEVLGDLGPSGSRVISASNLHLDGLSDHATTEQLASEYKVPADLRFSLFARVRLAKLGATPEGASTAAQIRLLAFCILLQSEGGSGGASGGGGPNGADDTLGLVFLTEPQPEFVAELLRVLRAEGEGLPSAVVELSLRVLAALAGDRSHQSGVITVMRSGGHPAVFSALVASAVSRLTAAPSPPVGAELAAAGLPKLELDAINAEADAPVPLAEALVSLLSTLVTTHGGCQTLRDVSLLPVLLPLLRNRNARHVHIVSHAVHVLEIFMDYTSSASAAFRELGGLELVVERLKQEAEDALAEHATTHGSGGSNGGGGVGGVGTGAGAAATTEDASAASKTYAGVTAMATEPTEPPLPPPSDLPPPAHVHLVSSARRVLLKALMRALALTNFAPGTAHTAAAGLEDGTLCHALNLIFAHPRLFGAGVFSLAANLLSDVMNHEPTCYPKLEVHGVPKAFLDAWEKDDPGPLPSGDALCCLPNTLGALCLSPAGLVRVQRSTALQALSTAFTTRSYSRALAGETSSVIGGNLDELLRHVPSLQPAGVRLAIDILRRMVELGGGDPGPVMHPSLPFSAIAAAGAGVTEEAAAEVAAAGTATARDHPAAAEGEDSPMDTDGVGPVAPAADVAMVTGAAAMAVVQAPAGLDGGPMQELSAAVAFPGEISPAVFGVMPSPAETSMPDAPAAPASEAAPVSAPAPTPTPALVLAPTPAVSPSFLTEAVANTARLIDSMLPTEECTRVFVESGGLKHLLQLHTLPLLPPTFSSSSACHALSVTLRALAAGHPATLATHVQIALVAVLDKAGWRGASASEPNPPQLHHSTTHPTGKKTKVKRGR
jgi:E3 ubiquitin-protein ligase HUWE1